MTERERLIELFKKTPYGANAITLSDKHKDSILGEIADYLLKNGVIVPPVKVGERRIDDLGRVHIPKNVRLPLGINYGDVISISVSDESIILRKEREENGTAQT